MSSRGVFVLGEHVAVFALKAELSWRWVSTEIEANNLSTGGPKLSHQCNLAVVKLVLCHIEVICLLEYQLLGVLQLILKGSHFFMVRPVEGLGRVHKARYQLTLRLRLLVLTHREQEG